MVAIAGWAWKVGALRWAKSELDREVRIHELCGSIGQCAFLTVGALGHVVCNQLALARQPLSCGGVMDQDKSQGVCHLQGFLVCHGHGFHDRAEWRDLASVS